MWMTWKRENSWLGIVVLTLAGMAQPVLGATLYKYKDENGQWVFTDRRPEGGEAFQQQDLKATLEEPTIELIKEPRDSGTVLLAKSTFFGPVQIAFQLGDHDNVGSQTPLSGDRLLPPRSTTELLIVEPEDVSQPSEFAYRFEYLPGDPIARHQPEQPYRLPYAVAKSFLVSQAPPDAVTHQDPGSRDAVDFAMPVGSGVYAARGGVVLDVASRYFRSGTNMQRDGPRANVVRVLHNDGTMAIYAHLNWNSIAVVPGQSVQRGEFLAASGNTGFSTGPHLHFVVQRNRGGQLVSVPVTFAGPNNRAQRVATGDTPIAY
ncbi:MAG: peptidoglycan DD-metalloendopeptidase family protein [Gammaproteobacteria bacterium]